MLRILVVDDDALVLTTLTMTLEALGHLATAVSSAREANEQIQPGRFDLVITDILMPEMDGLELIRAIRNRDAALRIIAVSGGGYRGTQDFLHFASVFGADAVLPKPFNAEALSQVIAQAMADKPPLTPSLDVPPDPGADKS